MKVRVTNIQRFSLHDGPGIRTTVFFKGCNLRCPWCANPENLNFEKEKYTDLEKKSSGIFGYDIEIEELEKEILKDKVFYSNEGGVTFSGGEPLLQINNIEKLLINLKKEKINICVETALFIQRELLEKSIKYVDEFIVDIKILEKEKCKDILHGDIDIYYENVKMLFENNCNVVFRIPMLYEYTISDENIKLILNLLIKYKPKKVQIFKVHNLAEKKYKTLNKKMIKYKEIKDEDVQNLLSKIKELGIEVQECKI